MVDSLVTLAYGLWRNSRTEFSVRSSSPAQQSDRRSPRSNTVSKHFNRAKFDFFRLGHWRQTVRWCGRQMALEETWPFVWADESFHKRFPVAPGIECVVSEIDIFISSSGNFNIITLDLMKKFKNTARSTWLLRSREGTTRSIRLSWRIGWHESRLHQASEYLFHFPC